MKKSEPAEKTFCAYIGPTVRGYCEHGMIFMSGIKEAEAVLAPFLLKYPAARSLIVDNKSFARARLEIKQSGNAMNEAYKLLLRQISDK